MGVIFKDMVQNNAHIDKLQIASEKSFKFFSSKSYIKIFIAHSSKIHK